MFNLSSGEVSYINAIGTARVTICKDGQNRGRDCRYGWRHKRSFLNLGKRSWLIRLGSELGARRSLFSLI